MEKILIVEFMSDKKSIENYLENSTVFSVSYTPIDNYFTEEMAKRKVLSEYKDAVFIDSNIR